MNKKVLVISTSMRQKGNSDQLADEFIKGAEDAGHTVGKITLYDKAIHFCKGCLACQNSTQGHCVFQDDAGAIKGLQGWIDCFEEARLKGVVYGTASDAMNAILTHPETLQAAYEMGSHV